MKKVPYIAQFQTIESGVCALSMILAYYDKWLSRYDVREACHISRSGVSVSDFIAAAEGYDLDVKRAKLDLDNMNNSDFPFVAIIHGKYYVVVTKIKHNTVFVMNPARGDEFYTKDQFADIVNEEIYILRPGENFHKSGMPRNLRYYISKRLNFKAKTVIALLLLYAVATCVDLVLLNFTKNYVDAVLARPDMQYNFILIAIMLVFLILGLVCTCLFSVKSSQTIGNMAAKRQTQLFYKIFRMPILYLEYHLTSDLLNRFKVNESLDKILFNNIFPPLIDAAFLAFYIFLMIYYSPPVGLALIIFEILYFVILHFLEKRQAVISMSLKRALVGNENRTLNAIDNICTLKSSGSEYTFFHTWSANQTTFQDVTLKMQRYKRLINTYNSFHNILIVLILISMSVICICNGMMTIGAMAALQSMIGALQTKINQVASVYDTLNLSMADFQRIEDIVETPMVDEVKLESEDDAVELKGNIDINNVSFSYSKAEKPAVKNVDISLAPKKTIAIVGQSGSGKSTLLNLITDLLEPDEGTIKFDDLPKSEIPDICFHDAISVVTQDIFLMEGKLRDNISFGEPDISDDEIYEALRDAEMLDVVKKRHQGLDYEVLHDGSNFSGGEAQRIEIARALARKPKILILDEATSALDASTEYNIIQNIRKKKISVIMVAHRLSTVRNSDKIYVMDNGKIAESGSHDELVKLKGKYYDLMKNQENEHVF